MTVIEPICASGRALPPYVVFKGKSFYVTMVQRPSKALVSQH